MLDLRKTCWKIFLAILFVLSSFTTFISIKSAVVKGDPAFVAAMFFFALIALGAGWLYKRANGKAESKGADGELSSVPGETAGSEEEFSSLPGKAVAEKRLSDVVEEPTSPSVDLSAPSYLEAYLDRARETSQRETSQYLLVFVGLILIAVLVNYLAFNFRIVFLTEHQFFLTFLIIVLCLVLFRYIGKQRPSALEKYAGEKGLSFSRKDLWGLPAHHKDLPLMKQSRVRIENILYGKRKLGNLCYEIKIADGLLPGGEHSPRLTLCLLEFKTGFPSLLLRPENLRDKLSAFVGLVDIQFESEEFNKQYYIQSSEKQFAYEIITPRAMEWLLIHRGFLHIEISGGAILFYLSSAQENSISASFLHPEGNIRFLNPDGIDYFYGEIQKFLQLLPPYVWEKHEVNGSL